MPRRGGVVDGLRVDHVDGLADPKAYLERLRQEAGPDCYITVEKILGEDEHIPSGWPISGTTGYEFISTISDALVDADKLGGLRTAYETITGTSTDMEAELRAAKLLMTDNNFAGEVASLLRLAVRIQQAENLQPALSEGSLKSALRELLVAFPVYRTYGTMDGMPPDSRKMLEGVLAKLRGSRHAPEETALALLENVLLGRVAKQAAGLAGEFRIRFQQLTGPLMAKSVEDTLFFRHHMLLALNEVGAEPLPRPFALDRFHKEMQIRLERQPDGLSGTSTHDTKRGEDARARLYALSEGPEVWAEAVVRWRGMNQAAVASLDDGAAPEPAVEWMLYQALAGAWPVDLRPEDRDSLRSLEERFVAYTKKALREAKLRTNWSEVNQGYEEAVACYARHLLSPDNSVFLADFVHTLRPFIRAGLVNSLTQTIVKLTAPGVPDIYQGSEGLDLSLVDPDNRRQPDFEALRARLAEEEKLTSTEIDDLQSGWLKQHIVGALLRLRQDAPTLFRRGEYLPLQPTGKHKDNIVAFARAEAEDALIVIAARRAFHALYTDIAEPRPQQWAQAKVILPKELCTRRYRDICSGRTYEVDRSVDVNQALAGRYFALLRNLRSE
ncbi:malto-oligosyltrehalose synthase [Neorhizobium petrolearium]